MLRLFGQVFQQQVAGGPGDDGGVVGGGDEQVEGPLGEVGEGGGSLVGGHNGQQLVGFCVGDGDGVAAVGGVDHGVVLSSSWVGLGWGQEILVERPTGHPAVRAGHGRCRPAQQPRGGGMRPACRAGRGGRRWRGGSW